MTRKLRLTGILQQGVATLSLILACGINCQANDAPAHQRLIASAVPASQTAHPIVDAKTAKLFGAVAGNRWLHAHRAASAMHGGEVYRLYTLSERLGTRVGQVPLPPRELCNNSTVRINNLPKAASEILAVGGDWEALPRVPRILDRRQRTYQNLMAERLHAMGISNPEVHLRQILRIDLVQPGGNNIPIRGPFSASHEIRAPLSNW